MTRVEEMDSSPRPADCESSLDDFGPGKNHTNQLVSQNCCCLARRNGSCFISASEELQHSSTFNFNLICSKNKISVELSLIASQFSGQLYGKTNLLLHFAELLWDFPSYFHLPGISSWSTFQTLASTRYRAFNLMIIFI